MEEGTQNGSPVSFVLACLTVLQFAFLFGVNALCGEAFSGWRRVVMWGALPDQANG